MEIVKIDFNFESHKKIIMKLAKSNEFYIEDLYIELYRDIFPKTKTFLKNFMSENEINKVIKDRLKGVEDHHGYFMTYIDENNKKKVIGFYIHEINVMIPSFNEYEAKKRSNLLFLLIDKRFQNKNYGRKLMNHCLDELTNEKVSFASVKSENEKTNLFYEKFGFFKSELLDEKHDVYEILYFAHDIREFKLIASIHMTNKLMKKYGQKAVSSQLIQNLTS